MEQDEEFWCNSIQNSSQVVGNKAHPAAGQEGPERGKMISPTLSLNSTLDGVGGQRHAPTALTWGKDRVPIV